MEKEWYRSRLEAERAIRRLACGLVRDMWPESSINGNKKTKGSQVFMDSLVMSLRDRLRLEGDSGVRDGG